MVMLIIQSAVINYERESRRIAVIKIQGYKFRDRYNKPILRFGLTWLLIGCALFAIHLSPEINLDSETSRFIARFGTLVSEHYQFRFTDPMLITGALSVFLLLDALITVVTFKFIENRRVVTTLKGET
jgi:hypothetical protein